MALPLNNNAEGGTNGTTVTTANSGGTSGNAFDNVVINSGSTVAFSNAQSAHGSLSIKSKTGTSTQSAYVTWGIASIGSQATLFGRIYVYFTGNVPSGGQRIIDFWNGGDNSKYIGGITMPSGAPQLAIQDNTYAHILTFSTQMSLNTWYRIEFEYQFQAGTATVKLFAGDSSTATEQNTVTGASFGGGSITCDTVNMGWLSGASNTPILYIDDLNINATVFPGPASPAGPTSTGSIALAPLAFNATGVAAETMSGGLALAPFAFAGVGGPIVPITSTGGITLAPLNYVNSTQVSFPFPLFILGIKIEIFINGTWVDISTYVYWRQVIQIQRGRTNWASGIQSSTMTMTLNNRDGRFSPLNTNGPYYPYIQRNVQIRVSIVNASSVSLVTYTGYRFNGEVYVWPPQSDTTGNDVYCTINASGILTRYLQGAKVGSPIRRYYASQVGGNYAPIAAWLCDDSTNAASMASMLNGGQPMTFTGKPSFMSDSSFLGSDPIAIVSGSTWHGQTGASANPPGNGSITEITPGTYTITAPPGVTVFTVTGIGSGGGGGDTDGVKGGSGGGGGELASASIGVTPNSTYTYTVPPGGAAGNSGNGFNGAAAIFTGDTQTLTANGGIGGGYAGGIAGAGGTGSTAPTHFDGGSGAVGQSSTTVSHSSVIQGKTGATGGGHNQPGTATTTSWIAPIGVSPTVTVNSYAAGGGGGSPGNTQGAPGGGAGAFATGTVSVTAGSKYTVYAGNGGNGASSNNRGDNGGNSGMSGDFGSAVVASGGIGGGTSSPGTGGGVSSGTGNFGGNGGAGALNGSSYGGGGGSGGSNAGPRANGANGNAGNQRAPGAASGSGGRGGWGAILSGGLPAGGQTNGQTGNQSAGIGGGGGGGGEYYPANSQGTPGGGGGPGKTTWSWTVTGQPSGGGGGSAAGPFSAGNPGTIGGLGGGSIIGNIADGTFESGVSDWAATNGVLTQVSTPVHNGSFSAKLAVTGTPAQANFLNKNSFFIPVSPSNVYTLSLWINSATASQNYQANINWYDASGSYISTSSSPVSSPAINTWINLINTATAPYNAAYAQYGPVVSTPSTGTIFYTDDITFSPIINAVSAGGNQGMPGTAPGGGGGGGLPASTDPAAPNVPLTPGNGAPGRMTISWNGGTTSPVPANIISLLLHTDPSGDKEGAVLFRSVTYGTINNIDLIYHVGGKLELKGFTGATTFFDSGAIPVGADGKSLAIQIQLTPNGSNINWSITVLDVNQGTLTATITGTANTINLGNISDVYVNPTGSMNSGSATAIGGIIVQNYADTLVNLATMLNGFNGEVMATRLARLCSEEGITFVLKGNVSDTPQMGPQIDDTFLNLLAACENADRGQVYEPREVFGIGYRTRINMQGQVPFILDYAQAMLSAPFQPVADYQLVKNDLTISRYLGASVTAQQLTGPMSIQSPPNGVGDYTFSETEYLYSDSQLASFIAWLLILGTVSQYRYPTVNLDLTRVALQKLFATIASMDIGDYFQVINAPSWMTPSTIDQLASGYTEDINSTSWNFSVNAVPEDPFSTPNPPTW